MKWAKCLQSSKETNMDVAQLTVEDFNGNADNYYNFMRAVQDAEKQLRLAEKYCTFVSKHHSRVRNARMELQSIEFCE